MRFVDSQWNVQQRLVRLQVLAKSLKAEELAQCLIQALAVEYAIQPSALLAAMKDGASVNQAALQQVRFFFPQLLDVTCFSHTIDNVGKHFEFRVLDTFACSRTVVLHALRGRPGLELLCGPTVRPDGRANGR